MIGQLSKEEINRKLLHIVAVALPELFFTHLKLRT